MKRKIKIVEPNYEVTFTNDIGSMSYDKNEDMKEVKEQILWFYEHEVKPLFDGTMNTVEVPSYKISIKRLKDRVRWIEATYRDMTGVKKLD